MSASRAGPPACDVEGFESSKKVPSRSIRSATRLSSWPRTAPGVAPHSPPSWARAARTAASTSDAVAAAISARGCSWGGRVDVGEGASVGCTVPLPTDVELGGGAGRQRRCGRFLYCGHVFSLLLGAVCRHLSRCLFQTAPGRTRRSCVIAHTLCGRCAQSRECSRQPNGFRAGTERRSMRW